MSKAIWAPLKLLAVATFALCATQAQAISVTGESVTIDLYVNGSFDRTGSGTVGAGNDANINGYYLFDFNAGTGEDLFSINTSSGACGWYCQGQTLTFQFTGFDFGEPFSVGSFASSMPNAIVSVTGVTTFEISFTDAPSTPGVPLFSGQFLPDSAAIVPAPASLPLIASGLGLMGFLGWRRRNQG